MATYMYSPKFTVHPIYCLSKTQTLCITNAKGESESRKCCWILKVISSLWKLNTSLNHCTKWNYTWVYTNITKQFQLVNNQSSFKTNYSTQQYNNHAKDMMCNRMHSLTKKKQVKNILYMETCNVHDMQYSICDTLNRNGIFSWRCTQRKQNSFICIAHLPITCLLINFDHYLVAFIHGCKIPS